MSEHEKLKKPDYEKYELREVQKSLREVRRVVAALSNCPAYLVGIGAVCWLATRIGTIDGYYVAMGGVILIALVATRRSPKDPANGKTGPPRTDDSPSPRHAGKDAAAA